jgi:hypothetical protein
VEVRGGDGETDAILPGAATVVGRGDAETDAVLAGAEAVEVGRGGAEMEAVVASAAGLDAGATALGGSLPDKSGLRPTPTTMKKRIIRTVPNGVLIAPTKFLAQSIFLFTVKVIGGRRFSSQHPRFCSQ